MTWPLPLQFSDLSGYDNRHARFYFLCYTFSFPILSRNKMFYFKQIHSTLFKNAFNYLQITNSFDIFPYIYIFQSLYVLINTLKD